MTRFARCFRIAAVSRKGRAGLLAAALALALAAQGALGQAVDVCVLFADPPTWGRDANAFVMEMRKFGFAFTDAGRTSAASSAKDAMTFGGLPVFETRVYWKGGVLSRAEISVYNRGDAALPIRKADFESLVAATGAQLEEKFGKGVNGPVEKPGANKFAKSVKWTGQSPMALMQWAYAENRGGSGGFMAEYIRVTFVPKSGMAAADNAALTGKSMLVKASNLMALKKNVAKMPKGDVYIDGVPMVDQGRKGYCAASSAERILRYYGLQIDQHQVAQLAETSAKSGTSLEGISEAVEAIGKQYSLTRETLIKADSGGKVFEKSSTGEDLADYNKTAKRLGKPQLDWHDFAMQMGQHAFSIDVGAIWAAMEPEVLLASRTAKKQQAAAFRRDVAKYVDMGVPLMWSCLVGIFPEVPDVGAQGAFGHMRLVIGYNRQTDELLYSDSWGGAHALKRMPMDQAWAMTKGLMVLKPRN